MNKSQITMKNNDYFRIASGFYLSEPLPDNYEDMEIDELEDFLEFSAWEAFQFYSGTEILHVINDLSDRFEMVAKDAKEKAIDSIVEMLKAKATNNQ
jgi:hypothetical protein